MSTHNICFPGEIRKICIWIHLLSGYMVTNKPSLFVFSVCVFVLRFYSPVNPMGSCRAWSVYLTTPLLDRLSPLSG